jgi:hypothetical protein
MILPLILIPKKLPKEFGVVYKAHYVTYLVKIVLPLQYLYSLLVLLSGSFALLKHLISPLLSLLSFLLLLSDLILLLFNEVLAAFLGSLLLHVPVMMFPLVFFHDLVPSFLSLTHLVIDVEFHVIYSHFDYVISLINFLYLLFRFIP